MAVALLAGCGLRFAGHPVNCALCLLAGDTYAPPIARIQSNCLPLEAGTHARTRLTRGTRATPSQARGLYGFRLIALNLVDTQTQTHMYKMTPTQLATSCVACTLL